MLTCVHCPKFCLIGEKLFQVNKLAHYFHFYMFLFNVEMHI